MGGPRRPAQQIEYVRRAVPVVLFLRGDFYASREVQKMAQKTREETKRKDWEVDFVHLELSSQDKLDLAKFDAKFEASFDCLSRLSLDGWKISFVHDSRNDCCIASITSPKVAGGERQVCLSARGPDLMQSMRVMCYKVVVLLDGDLTTLKATSESRGQWG